MMGLISSTDNQVPVPVLELCYDVCDLAGGADPKRDGNACYYCCFYNCSRWYGKAAVLEVHAFIAFRVGLM